MGKRTAKKIRVLTVLLLLSSILLSGCSIGTSKTTKLRDLEFTIVSEEKLPEELKQLIDERKSAPFKITYNDNEYLYICVGYGEQPTGGYSIAVNELYLTENAIYISTSLLGPGPEDKTDSAPSYPYIVVKTEYLDKEVMFE
ncbi:MAG TPA: protease complex subunit PrcB family protein [Lachnospiraceae bacterium]|nr:protease complex subunit PrcB family protein [Lachnospiraceae bacterium]